MYQMMRDGWRGALLYNSVDAGSVHCDVPNRCAWSRANLEEAAPGVITPLSWSFTDPSTVTSSRMIFAMMGVISGREITAPITSAGEAPSTVFYGRMALNVDYMRRYLARVPGADPDEFEKQILGTVRGRPADPRQRWRLPSIMLKLSVNARRYPAQTERNRASVEQWWRTETTAVSGYSREQALALFDEASRRHAELVGVHSFGFLIGQNHYSKLAALCAELGLPGHELELTGSGEGTVESSIVDHVQRIAEGTSTLTGFLHDHGYRGPDEGELSSRSWREDARPIEQLVELYRRTPRPSSETRTRFEASLRRLLAATPSRQHKKVSRLVQRVVLFMQLREIGKASFVRSKDVGRAAARRLGELLVQEGLLDDIDDVFLLTRRELGSPSAHPLREIARQRRQLRAEYQSVDLPDHFEGIPDTTPIERPTERSAAVSGTIVKGVAASPGVAEGTARVVRDPAQFDDFQPDDVLICELTDPAWAPLMQLSAAIVIDIGGALSHGAIVARELGIPAVIGTGDGTARIPDGAKVRVDGAAGEVLIL